MGRNEIRLRRQRMTARGIERFRNYNSVLKRHEENRRIKKIMRVFGFFLVLLVVIMVIIFLSRWEERAGKPISLQKKVSTAANMSLYQKPFPATSHLQHFQ
jgi:hypothetical protein